ncbi:GNAT family N-acetyltransferase [Oceanibium sediminis]|uniref:GNAT family N-acetyltransferase n=1 Tax=Oceanibium sediminis TaxID=2026339 RepID=UPI000DD3F1B3|nr:GNAT family N-acetyltransferase [Oceanibium sediminis]
MKVDVLRVEELSDDLAARWRGFQDASEDLASPFFSVEFCRIVGRARPDLRVAVIEDAGAPCGFFAFHGKRGGGAAPLAGQISDYHGIVGDPGVITATALLQGAGVSAFDFNHALRSQSVFAESAFRFTSSPLADLQDGFEQWRAARRAETKAILTVERRARKMAREIGELSFVANDPSPAAWEALLTWKRASLAQQRSGLVLDVPWVKAIAEGVRASEGPAFSGVLSTLRAGDRLVAVHFGMRSKAAWHWWFPTYDAEMGAYSPGLILLLECVRHGAASGLRELDLGRGEQRYKREFANRERLLCEGSIERVHLPAGAARYVRKTVHSLSDRILPERYVDLERRVFNRVLGAGKL